MNVQDLKAPEFREAMDAAAEAAAERKARDDVFVDQVDDGAKALQVCLICECGKSYGYEDLFKIVIKHCPKCWRD